MTKMLYACQMVDARYWIVDALLFDDIYTESAISRNFTLRSFKSILWTILMFSENNYRFKVTRACTIIGVCTTEFNFSIPINWFACCRVFIALGSSTEFNIQHFCFTHCFKNYKTHSLHHGNTVNFMIFWPLAYKWSENHEILTHNVWSLILILRIIYTYLSTVLSIRILI